MHYILLHAAGLSASSCRPASLSRQPPWTRSRATCEDGRRACGPDPRLPHPRGQFCPRAFPLPLSLSGKVPITTLNHFRRHALVAAGRAGTSEQHRVLFSCRLVVADGGPPVLGG